MNMDADRRILILQERLAELRKTYLNIKSEVAVLDRKKKKARRKDREKKEINKNNNGVDDNNVSNNNNQRHNINNDMNTRDNCELISSNQTAVTNSSSTLDSTIDS
jgi:hypothetical protein